MQRRLQARSQGFSLIEMMMAVAVIAILLGSALPNWRATTVATHMRLAKDALLDSVTRARNLAVMRNHEVGVCPSIDSHTCTGGLEWQGGWIVFDDHDRDGAPNGDEDLISVAAPTPGLVVLATVGRPRLTFRPDGSSAGSNVTITLCDERGVAQARSVVVSNVGRPRMGAPSVDQAEAACALRANAN